MNIVFFSLSCIFYFFFKYFRRSPFTIEYFDIAFNAPSPRGSFSYVNDMESGLLNGIYRSVFVVNIYPLGLESELPMISAVQSHTGFTFGNGL